jgi:hypothetical protein
MTTINEKLAKLTAEAPTLLAKLDSSIVKIAEASAALDEKFAKLSAKPRRRHRLTTRACQMSGPVKYGSPAFAASPKMLRRGITSALRLVSIASRELPLGPERALVSAKLRDISGAIRDLESRLLPPYAGEPQVIGARECRR